MFDAAPAGFEPAHINVNSIVPYQLGYGAKIYKVVWYVV
jgi:hypothetical protein